MNQLDAIRAARQIALPLQADGYKFAGLYRYRGVDGIEVYAKLCLRHPGTGKGLTLHLAPGANGYERRNERPDLLPPYARQAIAARAGDVVFLVADEATADALLARGILATAADPRGDWTALTGRRVLAWEDRDDFWFAGAVDQLVSAGVQIELVDTDVAGSLSDWLAAHPATVPPDLMRSKLLALPRIRLHSRVTAEEAPEGNGTSDRRPAAVLASRKSIRETMGFLRDNFGGTVRPVAEIREAAALAGFRWRSIQAASTRLGVGKSKCGMRGGWWWSVPAHEDTGGSHEDARAETAPTSEDTRADGGGVPASEGQNTHESVQEMERSDTPAVQEVRTKVGGLPLAKATSGSSPGEQGQTVDQTVGEELVKRVTTELVEDARRPYAIRARLLSDGSAQIAIAARKGSGEIEAASLQVRCGEAALRSAFGLIGGRGRVQFEEHADLFTGLFGRAQALAHATVEVLGSVVGAAPNPG